MPSFVECRNVTKTYHVGEVTIPAANGIDFSIEKGEFVVIVGPSGAGKTTSIFSEAWTVPPPVRFW